MDNKELTGPVDNGELADGPDDNFDEIHLDSWGEGRVYACKACGALVWFSDRYHHVEWHRMLDPFLRERKRKKK